MTIKRLLILAGALAALAPAMPFFNNETSDYARIVRLEARVRRLEALLEALLNRQGIDPAELIPPAPTEERAIRDALLSGNKILAIKLYRQQYGVGLKEAKDAIDRMLIQEI